MSNQNPIKTGRLTGKLLRLKPGRINDKLLLSFMPDPEHELGRLKKTINHQDLTSNID